MLTGLIFIKTEVLRWKVQNKWTLNAFMGQERKPQIINQNKNDVPLLINVKDCLPRLSEPRLLCLWSKVEIEVLSEVAQLCQTLCDPVDCSLSGCSVHGILQSRILEWVAIPSPGDLPNPGIEPRSPTLQADALPSEPPGKPRSI